MTAVITLTNGKSVRSAQSALVVPNGDPTSTSAWMQWAEKVEWPGVINHTAPNRRRRPPRSGREL